MSYLITGEYVEKKNIETFSVKKDKIVCGLKIRKEAQYVGKILSNEMKKYNKLHNIKKSYNIQKGKNVEHFIGGGLLDAICDLHKIKSRIDVILKGAQCIKDAMKGNPTACIEFILEIFVEYCTNIGISESICGVISYIKDVISMFNSCFTGTPVECIFEIVGMICNHKDDIEQGIDQAYCYRDCGKDKYCDVDKKSCVPKKENQEYCSRSKQCKKECGQVRNQDNADQFNKQCCDSVSTYYSTELTTNLCDRELKGGKTCRYNSECETLNCEGNALGLKLGKCTKPLAIGRKCNNSEECSGNKDNKSFCNSSGKCAKTKKANESCDNDNEECQTQACGRWSDNNLLNGTEYRCCKKKDDLEIMGFHQYCTNLVKNDACTHDDQCKGSLYCEAGKTCKMTNSEGANCYNKDAKCSSKKCALYHKTGKSDDTKCCSGQNNYYTYLGRQYCTDIKKNKPCTYSDQCSGNLTCYKNKCVDKKSNGSACDSDDNCQRGRCGRDWGHRGTYQQCMFGCGWDGCSSCHWTQTMPKYGYRFSSNTCY